MKTLLCFLFLLTLADCAVPAAGTRCDAGVAYCASPTGALSCQDGTLVQFTCTGPKGCSIGPSRSVQCDQTGAAGGSSCFPEYEGKGHCSTDGTATLQCTKGVWVAVACPSGQSCGVNNSGVACR